MTRGLIIRPEAATELADAAAWYDDQRDGLGIELLADVRQTIDTIIERPESFPVVYRTARRALAGRFPYIVYFAVRPNAVIVIAILHSRRDQAAILKTRQL